MNKKCDATQRSRLVELERGVVASAHPTRRWRDNQYVNYGGIGRSVKHINEGFVEVREKKNHPKMTMKNLTEEQEKW